MLSHRFRSARVVAGTLVTLGALGAAGVPLAVSASPAGAAETSSFVAYSGSSYTGTAKNISGCGVHNMPYAVGSYKWYARGQSGDMYNVPNASGVIVATLSSSGDASQSTGVGWKSIFIVC